MATRLATIVRICPSSSASPGCQPKWRPWKARAAAGSVVLWLRRERVQFPLRRFPGEVRWVEPSYHQVHSVLTNPVYAGAYAYGKTRRERYVDEHGQPRKRIRRLPREEWVC